MPDTVKNHDLKTGDSFILGAWLVTPSLNTLTLINRQYKTTTNDSDISDSTSVVRKVTPKVMALCEFLVRHHRQAKSQQEITQEIWPERVISDSSIYQAIAQLRKALQHDSDDIQYVERVSGKGYRIIAPITFNNTIAKAESKPINKQIQQTEIKSATKSVLKKTHPRIFIVITILLSMLLILIFINNFYKQADLVTSPIKTIAIFPTENLSSPNNDVFNNFSQLILSEVVSESSHKFIYLRKGGNEKSAQTQLLSTIQGNHGQLLASIQLLDSSTGKVLWAENFTAKKNNYLQLKNDVVTGLLSYLMPQKVLKAKENSNVLSQDTHFEEYALAHFFWDKREPNALNQAKTVYLKILQQSPNHLGALVGLCHTYLYLSVYSDLPQELAHQHCKPYISKAIELAPNKGEVIATQALLKLYIDDQDNDELEKLFRRSIKAAPNYAMAHHWYGNYLRQIGNYQQGLIQHRLAYSLDPLSPILIRGLAYAYLNLRELNNARKYYQRALVIEPNYAHRALAELDFLLLNSTRAKAFLVWLNKPSNISDKPVYRLTQALVWLGIGNIEKAQQLIEQTKKNSTNKAFLLYCQGALASAKGDYNLALIKMKERLNITPNVNRYAMPYITALFYNNDPKQALNVLQHYFPKINNTGMITNENSGQYVLLSRIYQRLKDSPAQKNINNKLSQFISHKNNELSAINQIYWAFINNQHQQTLQLINQQFKAGWLPDYNDNIFEKDEFKRMYLNSSGSVKKWKKMLKNNRKL